jgi:hypothetical protein
LIASILDEQDWYVDASQGIRMYEFDRLWKDGAYKMLHLVMDVRRKDPPSDRRGPGQDSPAARKAYETVVDKLFAEKAVVVTEALIDQAALKKNLDAIKARRREIYPEGE